MANKIIGVLTNRRAQATIWIILAVLLVASMVIFFTVINRGNVNIIPEQFEPRSFIEQCTRDAVLEAEEIMLPQGGFIEPENYKIYNDYKVEYLCQHIGNYKPCIMQHPVYLQDLKDEIRDYASPIIDECFSTLEREMVRRGNDAEIAEDQEIDVDLSSKRIYLNVRRQTTLTRGESVVTIDSYDVEIASPLYDLALVAIDIANQEALFCYFEYAGYTNLYPEFRISPFTMSDSTEIYTIKDKRSNKELNIAIRGCAMPAGF